MTEQQRRKEITDAAIRGIRDYLDTTRGAHHHGEIEGTGKVGEFKVVFADDTVLLFTTMEF